MLEKLRPWFKRIINPIAKGMAKIGLTANAVTVIGTFSTQVFFLFDASATVTDTVNLPAFVGTPVTLPLL